MSADDLVSVLPDPMTVEWDGRTVVMERFATKGALLECVVTFRKDGVEQPFSNPWRLVDPPGDTQEWMEGAVKSSGFFSG